jgi:3-methylcrotonyl-CoA carboxylase beta subunit
MSAKGIPQIACVMGICTAGGAYVPAMSDETRDREGTGHDLPRRPAAGEGGDGEEISAEDLGGGDLHRRKSGVTDHLAENDEHALTIVRDIVSTWAQARATDLRGAAPPKYAAEELYCDHARGRARAL